MKPHLPSVQGSAGGKGSHTEGQMLGGIRDMQEAKGGWERGKLTVR